jgi:hypothetical protein
MRGMMTAEMYFLTVVTGIRMMDHEHNEDSTEELKITNINATVQNYKK